MEIPLYLVKLLSKQEESGLARLHPGISDFRM
jgi:hypothetical protein